jgi:hypothetical protein
LSHSQSDNVAAESRTFGLLVALVTALIDLEWPNPPAVSRRVPEILPEAHATADWDRTGAQYSQCIDIVANELVTYLPDELPAELAASIADISSVYQGREEKLAEHALAVFAEIEECETFDAALFERLYTDERFTRLPAYRLQQDGRRRPTPFEAVIETARRSRDATNLQRILAGVRSSGVLGGSTSYGRFYNVCGQSDTAPSDLDFVIVLENVRDLGDVARRMYELPGIDAKDVDIFIQRIHVFASAYNDQKTILSHKFKMWRDGIDPMVMWPGHRPGYLLSLHFLMLPVLAYVLVESCTKLVRQQAGKKRTVRDFRNTPTDRPDHQRTFAGRSHIIPNRITAVDRGYLTLSRVYYLDDQDRYCPGIIQNLMLPMLDVRWDELDARPKLSTFRHKLMERLRMERRETPGAHLCLSLSHTRHQLFAPHIIRLLDADMRAS